MPREGRRPWPWRLRLGDGSAVEFGSELGVRTAAGIRRGRGLAVVVEHLHAGTWHECGSGLCPAHPRRTPRRDRRVDAAVPGWRGRPPLPR